MAMPDLLTAPTEPNAFDNIATDPTENTDVQVEGLSDANTVYNRELEQFNRGSQGPNHDFMATRDVGWSEASRSRSVDDSFIRHGFNLLRDLSDSDMRGTESELVQKNIQHLMTGIDEPHLYVDEILETGNMELAQRLVDRIRRQEENNRMYAHQGGVANASAAMVGFLMDPANAFGVNVATKIGIGIGGRLMAKGVGKGKAVMGSQMLAQTGFEAVRTTPRLLTDPTFQNQQYMTNLAMVMAATGLFSAVPSAMYGLRQGRISKGAASMPEVRINRWADQMDAVNNQSNKRLVDYKNQQLDKNIEMRTAHNDPQAQLPAPHKDAMTLRDQANAQVRGMTDFVKVHTEAMVFDKGAFDATTLGLSMDELFTGFTNSFRGDKQALANTLDSIKELPTFQGMAKPEVAPVEGAPTVQAVEPPALTPRQVQSDIKQATDMLEKLGEDMAPIQRAFDGMDGKAMDEAARSGAPTTPRETFKREAPVDTSAEVSKHVQSLKSLYDAGLDLKDMTGIINRATHTGQGLSRDHLFNSLENNGMADTLQQISQRGSGPERVIARRLYTGVKALEDAGQLEIRQVTDLSAPAQVRDYGHKGYLMEFSGRTEDIIPAQEMILHEAVHLLTMRILNDGDIANKGLSVLRDQLKSNHKLVNYAKEDNHELLAMALTNPTVQEFMQTMPAVEGTPWTNFTTSMAKTHGIPSNAHSAWSNVLQVSDGIMPGAGYASITDQVRAAVNATGGNPEQLLNLSENISHEIRQVIQRMDAQNMSLTPMQRTQVRESVLAIEDMVQGQIAQSQNMPTMRQKFQDITDAYNADPAVAKVREQYNGMFQKGLSHQWGHFSHSMASRLMRTEAPLAEWFAQTVLELPSGTGGLTARKNTASILSETLNMPFTHKLGHAWETAMNKMAADQNIPYFQKLKARKSSPNQDRVAQEFSDMIMLEMNARRLGRTGDSPDYVKEFANSLNEMNNDLYDMQFKAGIDGITGNNKMKNYVKQNVAQGAFLTGLAEHGAPAMNKLVRESLIGGGVPQEAAEPMATALVGRMRAAGNKRQMDETMPDHQEIIQAMKDDGVPDDLIELAMANLRQEDVPGYTNTRSYNFDLSAEVDGLRMLDFMDKDIVMQASRYSKEATGLTAMSKATDGLITSMRDADELIQAMNAQAQSMGKTVNTQDVTRVVRSMLGLSYDGQMPANMRKIRDSIALAGMNGLGESQLAEAGLAMNRGVAGLVGTKQWMNAATAKFKESQGILPTSQQLSDRDFMHSLQELTGLMEDLHLVERRGVHFDAREQANTMNAMQKGLDAGTLADYMPTLQWMQSKFTGYGAIRTAEEQIAMAGALQDFAKYVNPDRTSYTSLKRFTDMGFTNPDGTSTFSKYFEDGTVRFDDNGNVSTLNLHRWTPEDKESLSVALARHAGQTVQKSFPGEVAPEMMTPTGAMINQFKSYPITAAEKQQARNFKFADKQMAHSLIMNSISSAIARSIRYHSISMALPEGEREAYMDMKHDPANFAYDSFVYMGMAGMLPQLNEMSGMLAGQSVLNKGQGDNLWDAVPAVGWAKNYIGGAEGAANLVMGSNDEQDLVAIQKGMPLGTIKYMNFIAGLLRTRMEESGDFEPVTPYLD